MDSKNVIIIHPGSLNLRIGRASDLNPITVLHAIARRQKLHGFVHRETFLPPTVDLTPTKMQEIEDVRLAVSYTLQSCLQSDGRRRYATPPQQIAAFNKRSVPTHLEDTPTDWLYTEEQVIIGNDVLAIKPSSPYNIHFPMKRGDLNLHSGPGGSVTAVLHDLEAIWSHVLLSQFDIKRDQLCQYQCVLVISDVFNRFHLREFTTLLLQRMGFKACFLCQDHVAATFGSGYGHACVIDVGDQKTSVSCVDDGISIPSTRIRLGYGGADITQTLFWLLKKCAFPYIECDPSNKLDTMLLRNLKEEFCHVDLNVCGPLEKTFTIRHPLKPVVTFTIQIGDECIVAPLSLFSPELFGLTGSKAVQVQSKYNGDAEDPFDEYYLAETRKKGLKDNLEPSMDMNEPYEATANQVTADDDIVVDTIEYNQASKDFVINPGQVLGLDQAVLQSIDRCPSDEIKRKMYGCILIVGGGMKFAGISTWLHNRLSLQTPACFRDNIEIIMNPREIDSQMVAWKGAGILSCLETAEELWITAPEWQMYGVRVLRERAPFAWGC